MEAPDIRIYRPPAGHPLEPYVFHIFRVRTDAPYRNETILPKGNADLLFNLGEPVAAEGLPPGAYDVPQGAVWAGGLKTLPYSIRPLGRMYLIGVALRAEGSAALLPLSPTELINREAHDPPRAAEMRLLGEQLHEIDAFPEQCALLMRWLAARLRPPRGAGVVRHACALLRQASGEDAVSRVAKAVAVSPRHLRRMVGEQVGIRPAEYVRLARFIRATRQMGEPGCTLAQVALACGYYDQAHFCREFRAFAGMTPQEFRPHANGPVAGHIIEV